MSDDDESINAVISSLLYSSSISHLLCVFHIVDLNMKKHTQSILQSKEGANEWPQFRKALEICREVGSVQNLKILWDDIWRNGLMLQMVVIMP